MPDVTIDGKKVIMAQGVDGTWYAYIADGATATSIDSNYPEVEDGKGADYGRFCAPGTPLEYNRGSGTGGATNNVVASLKATESRGVAIPQQLGLTTTDVGSATFSYTQGTGVDTSCSLTATSTALHTAGAGATGVNASDQAINNVVRESRALSNGTSTDFYGNIALGPTLWPFIQLLSLIHI